MTSAVHEPGLIALDHSLVPFGEYNRGKCALRAFHGGWFVGFELCLSLIAVAVGRAHGAGISGLTV